jgi:RND family efflux transporter MFP subunit
VSVAKGKGWGWLGWLLVAVVGLGVVGWWVAGHRVFGRSSDEAEKKTPKIEPRAVAVTVEPVTSRPVRRTVPVVGSLYGREEIALSPKVEGRIVKIRHDVGDRVKPGDVLLEIDPTDYRLAVEENRRALELELAKLGLKELPAGTLDVTALPSVAKAAAQEKNAAARRDRMRRLGGGTASAEERDQADTEHAVARANYQQAVLDAEATLAAARHRSAALETARQRLRDTTVVVPPCDTSGAAEFAVCGRNVSEGEIVRTMPFGEQQSMFRLVIDQPLKFKATVPERHRGEIKVGQDAELEVEAYPGRKFAGKVSRVNPSVDRASRTFQAEILVPNEERHLSAGSFAKASVLTQVDPAAATVPEEAVIDFAGVTKVFTVVDNRAREVKVRVREAIPVGSASDVRTWLEVEGELPSGSVVVTSGQSKLADGSPVRVR